MEYVLDHAPKGASYVAALNGADIKVQELEGDDAKLDWVQSMKENDAVFTVFGVSDTIALSLYSRGVRVYRLPIYHLPGKGRRTQGSRSIKTSLAPAIAEFATMERGKFYGFRPLDAKIAYVRAIARAFYMLQDRLRKPAQLRLQSAYRELYLIEDVPAEMKVEQYVKQMVARSGIFQALTEEEERWKERLKEALKGIPIWEKLLKGSKVRGIGVGLGGMLIGEINDVRRFPKRDALVHYCGAHVTPAPDYLVRQGIMSELARRRSGQVANWHQRLRVTLWKWAYVQIPKMATQAKYKDDPWCQKFLGRKNYEVSKRDERGISEKGIIVTLPGGDKEDESGGERVKQKRYYGKLHLHKRAAAWLRTQFVRWLYAEWTALVEEGKM